MIIQRNPWFICFKGLLRTDRSVRELFLTSSNNDTALGATNLSIEHNKIKAYKKPAFKCVVEAAWDDYVH